MINKISRRFFLSSLLLIPSLIIGTEVITSEDVLVIGAIPDQNPEHLNRLYKMLSNELEKSLNIRVKYLPVTSYPAAVSAFRTGNLDLVWFGGLTGVQARIQTPGSKVIAQRDIDIRFRSVFIANTKSKIPVLQNQNDLKKLKGKRFTFGSESSTSGRLMPQYFLQEAGIKTTDFKGARPGFSGSHDATIALVQSGSYEAGALNKQVWQSNIKRGRVNKIKVKVIWETPTYADYHWLAQGSLDQRFGSGFTKRLQETLLGMNQYSKNQKQILEMFGAKRFISANNNQYTNIERIGRQLGKIR